MTLASLLQRNRHRDAALDLHASIVEQARLPAFFLRCGVPDTLDGRFELLALHGFLVLNRLKIERTRGAALAQALFDVIFLELDRALREIGVGDLGVGRQVKTMAKAFYGRIAAYEAGLASPDPAPLVDSLRRNLYGTVIAGDREIGEIATYMHHCATVLSAQPIDAILAGRIVFPAAPGLGDGG